MSPTAFRFRNVSWLSLFRPAGKEHNQLVAVLSEINTVAGAEIDTPFKDSRADRLHVAEVSFRNAVKGGRNLGGTDRVSRLAVPLAERTEPQII